jgi:hypothetical protein
MKKLLGIIAILGLVAAGLGYYYYNKPTESLADAKPVFTVSADTLFAEFESDESTANKKYLDKTIEVTGKVMSVNADTSGLAITLETTSGMFGVICKLEDKQVEESAYQAGQRVKMKGQCTGYLMDVVLVRCVEVKE